MRRKLFISYAHEDEAKAIRFQKKLSASGVADELIFRDRAAFGIHPGDDWLERIEDEISDSRSVLFLISDDFRTSRFICDHELPAIIRVRDRDRRVKLFWIRLTATDVPEDLKPYQGFCADDCLNGMSEADQEIQIEAVARALRDSLEVSSDIEDEFYARISAMARQDFGLRIRPRPYRGNHSIAYVAEGPGLRRIVKARIPRVFGGPNALMQEDVDAFAEKLRGLRHPAFIPFEGAIIRRDLQIVVSDFVPRARSLSDRLAGVTERTPLPIDNIRVALSSIAAALAEYHGHGILYGNIRPSDVLIERPTKETRVARIPALRFAQLDAIKRQSGTAAVVNPEIMTYLAPEQHDGRSVSEKTDQYALGLLAVEMIQGKAPVAVQRLADLREKERFFANPRRLSGPWNERSPRLTRVILRMLAPDPDDRFESMADVAEALRTLPDVREDNRRIAKQSYNRLGRRRGRALARFYEMFFEVRADLGERFARRLLKDRHHKKLNQAILYLLNFRADDAEFEPTTLSAIRNAHGALGLAPEDFDDFKTCLLETLREFGEESEEVQKAWRATIEPGMDYMRVASVEPAD